MYANRVLFGHKDIDSSILIHILIVEQNSDEHINTPDLMAFNKGFWKADKGDPQTPIGANKSL